MPAPIEIRLQSGKYTIFTPFSGRRACTCHLVPSLARLFKGGGEFRPLAHTHTHTQSVCVPALERWNRCEGRSRPRCSHIFTHECPPQVESAAENVWMDLQLPVTTVPVVFCFFFVCLFVFEHTDGQSIDGDSVLSAGGLNQTIGNFSGTFSFSVFRLVIAYFNNLSECFPRSSKRTRARHGLIVGVRVTEAAA